MKILDQHISEALNDYGRKLQSHFGSDVVAYMGGIHPIVLPHFIEFIEALNRQDKNKQKYPDRLVIVLTTNGGVVEAVEKMVEITRYHYKEIFFIVPDAAMSAGTIWCMSGDKIFMDYASSLGPIDPQVSNQEKKLVPALGYLDKANEFIDKSRRHELAPAEYIMLKALDLATLRRYEQARDLSVSLLKQWLVRYKFKDWIKHRTTKPGSFVTDAEKDARAEYIAKELSNNKYWHSHGRMIGIQTLRDVLRLEIDDYSKDAELRYNVRMYNGLLAEYFEKENVPFMFHSERI
ncbi:MAG TPA: serine dehydrogenasease [Gammaproteobacteria bacterium]|nr:serine dehydrogenasease [Gammaproteobacteria bacterium]